MKSSQRHTAMAVGSLALSLVGAPLIAQANQQQRGMPPNGDTPYILIAAFHSTDRKLGADMADELRKRIASERSAKELYVIPRQNVNNTLEASGYKPDSALNASDLMELAKQLRGEQVIDGTINKSASGVHVEARVLMRTGPNTVVQPLPAFDAKDAGDAAAKIERSLSDAAKSFPAYKTCTNDLRASKYDDAVKDARIGLAAYPNSSLARLCILSAYSSQKATPDSIISVSRALMAIEPTNTIALANLADAYLAKGDTTNAIQTQIQIWRANPQDVKIVQSIIQMLVTSGAPDKALPLIDTLLVSNPGDPEMLSTKWKLQLRANRWKEALATGRELAKADTASTNLDYFNRMIGAAQQDSNTAAVQELSAAAAKKFPNDASFALLGAQNYLKAGQLQQALEAARRAAAANPKDSKAWLFELAVFNQMNQPDSVIATAQKAIAAGVSKDELGNSLLATAGPALKKAQETKDRADWEAALKAAQTVDAITPSAQTKFYVGVSSFQVGLDAVQNVQKLMKSTKKEDKEKACSEDKVAEDNFAIAAIAMPAGGSVNKEAAGQIMGALGQTGEFVSQVKTALKCK